jgi:hypothetical protein
MERGSGEVEKWVWTGRRACGGGWGGRWDSDGMGMGMSAMT